MGKTITSLGLGILALLLFFYLCWAAGTDAQGAIGLLFYLPIIIGLFIASLRIAKGTNRITITLLVSTVVLVAVFYISALGSIFFKPLGSIPKYILDSVSQTFESVVGISSYEWGHRGKRLIHDAAQKGNIEKLENLLKNGTSIDYPNHVGETPLFYCVNSSQKQACQYLIKNGASINHQRIDGSTALHVAVYNKNLDMVKLLVESGVNISARDNNHKTALEIAKNEKIPLSTIIDYLVNVPK